MRKYVKQKKSGPNMDPWGTPQDAGAEDEDDLWALNMV